MKEADVYLEQVEALSDFLELQLADVPQDKLHQRPGPHQNTVGWNYWHLLRIWDMDLNGVAKGLKPEEDAWHRGDFTAKTGYNPDGKGLRGSGLGVGYTDDEVDELQMELSTLKEYHDMLLAETRDYLASVDPEELRREIPHPFRPNQKTKIGKQIQHLISHSYNHGGELRYAKGLLGIHDPTYPGK